MKAYFSMKNPPVKIAKIAIGDGTYTSEEVFAYVPAVSPFSPSSSFYPSI